MILSRYTKVVLAFWTALVMVCIYGPIVVTMAGAFLPMKAGVIQSWHPTLKAFSALFRDNELIYSLLISVGLGLACTAVATALAVLLALFVVARGGVHAKFVPLLVTLPFVMPAMITGLALLIFFRDIGFSRSLLTVAVGHILLVLAPAYRLVHLRLTEMGRSLTEASQDLGATGTQTVIRVILPNIAGAIGVGAMLCFAISFDETILTLLLTGTESTLPVRLWGMTRLGISQSANAMLVILVIVTMTLCALAAWRIGKNGKA